MTYKIHSHQDCTEGEFVEYSSDLICKKCTIENTQDGSDNTVAQLCLIHNMHRWLYTERLQVNGFLSRKKKA